MSQKHTLNSNERLLQILMHIASASKPLFAQEMSQDTGIPVSSLYRYLAILRDWNLVEENHATNQYVVGPAALQLLRNFNTFSPLVDGVRPILKKLQQTTGEMSAYMVPVGFHALCVEQIDSPYALRCTYDQGQSQPLISGASSKVLLAFLPEERMLSILSHFGCLNDQEQWLSELSQIRADGLAVSTSEFDIGVSSVSAPVFFGHKVVGAISVMAPVDRIDTRKQSIITAVLHAAESLPVLI